LLDTTKHKFAALIVDKWLYIDGGEIWAKWYGLNTSHPLDNNYPGLIYINNLE
jgi:hypothetical protein